MHQCESQVGSCEKKVGNLEKAGVAKKGSSGDKNDFRNRNKDIRCQTSSPRGFVRKLGLGTGLFSTEAERRWFASKKLIKWSTPSMD